MGRITLPSGVIGEVRGLSGRDGRHLANEQAIRDHELDDLVLTSCWTHTIENGPYDFKGKPPDWGKMLVGDRFFALIAIREASYPGQDYTMKLQCPRRPVCGKRFEWDIQLGKLLEQKTKRLAPKDAETFKSGNVFEDVIPGTETAFSYRLKTGDEAKRTQALIEAKKTGPKKQQQRQNLIVDSLASYIVEIAGVPRKRDAIFDALEDLPLGSLDALMPLIQSHDCGVDTEIEVFCPMCQGEMTIQLPFGKAFFLPSSAAAKFLPDASSEPETDPKESGDKKALDPLEA